MQLLIATDNTNTFDIFTLLAAQLAYNPILMSTVNVLLRQDLNLWVVYIPGSLNYVTDASSRYKNDLAQSLVPGIQIYTFIPLGCAWGSQKMISITEASRQPHREPLVMDCFSYEWSILLSLSIDSTTTTTNSYLTFCKKNTNFQLNQLLTHSVTISPTKCISPAPCLLTLIYLGS